MSYITILSGYAAWERLGQMVKKMKIRQTKISANLLLEQVWFHILIILATDSSQLPVSSLCFLFSPIPEMERVTFFPREFNGILPSGQEIS